MVAKNKPAASKDKSSSNAKNQSKGKKKKDAGSGGGSSAPKAEITVILKEEHALKILKNAKVITVQELARQTGVKISAANVFLREATQKGLVKIVGGNSGHRVYQPVS